MALTASLGATGKVQAMRAAAYRPAHNDGLIEHELLQRLRGGRLREAVVDDLLEKYSAGQQGHRHLAGLIGFCRWTGLKGWCCQHAAKALGGNAAAGQQD